MSEFGPLEWVTITIGGIAAVVAIGIGISDWWVLRRDAQQHKGWR